MELFLNIYLRHSPMKKISCIFEHIRTTIFIPNIAVVCSFAVSKPHACATQGEIAGH